MARLSYTRTASHRSTKSLDLACVELRQLLTRMQQHLLHPDSERERRLRTNEYERTKMAANLDHARTVLTRLEQEALILKAPAGRLELLGTLAQQKELLELLVDRMQDIKQIAVDDDDDTSEGEDILGELTTTSKESRGSMPSGDIEPETFDPSRIVEHFPPEPTRMNTSAAAAPALINPEPLHTSQEALPPAPTQTSQELRGRSAISSLTPPAHTTARAALFANRRRPASPQISTGTAEAILDHQRAEQDQLSESILKMAGALKASSRKFADTLEADKEVVGQAGEGIAKTERGMEAARGRMGALRRMTEGKGWWGRMILYAWVYGLMLALVLLVFVFPKLRF